MEIVNLQFPLIALQLKCYNLLIVPDFRFQVDHYQLRMTKINAALNFVEKV